MKTLSSIVLLVALCTAELAPRATPVEACPDRVAVTRPGMQQSAGPTQTCGLGITIFDLPILVASVPCPAFRITIPPHETCEPVADSGTMCIDDGYARVLFERCKCVSASGSDLSLHVPVCDCGPPLTRGILRRMRTYDC